MPVLFQKVIMRQDARRNSKVLYVFGDNVVHKGFYGQARELRNEPNAVGIRTKYTPQQYFAEAPAETIAQTRMIDQDMKRLFEHVKHGGIVVWPTDGIGTGAARMHIQAPTTFEHLEAKFEALLEMDRLSQIKRVDN
jgi:hypothetical protein